MFCIQSHSWHGVALDEVLAYRPKLGKIHSRATYHTQFCDTGNLLANIFVSMWGNPSHVAPHLVGAFSHYS